MKTGIMSNFKGDLAGGITAGVIALPLAIAFGVASGLGAAAGICGSIIVGLLASIFGGAPTQISGPTGPLTVVIASVFALHSNNPNLIFAAILLSGVFQIILGLCKVGKLINFVAYPVISGFMSGIGAIIILLEINPLLGLNFHGTPIEGLINVFKSFNMIVPESVILSALTLLIVFFTPKKIGKIIPPPLIALVAVTAFSIFMGFNTATIGEIPTSFPSLTFPVFKLSEIETIIPIALTLAVLGSLDSLLTALVADSLTKAKHNSDKELLGQGIGNFVVALFGGIACCGATMRTAVNVKNGGRTRLSGIIHSLFLISIVVFFAPLAAKIPLAVLAGILIKVGVSIIDYKLLKIIKAAPKNDLLVMLLVFLITVFDDLILAVGVGVILSSILFAANVAKQTDIKLINPEEYLEEDFQNKIMIMHIDGVLFFGSASQVASRIDDVLDNKSVIIDCTKIKSMDISAVFALEDLILTLQGKNVDVIIAFNNREIAASTLKLGLRRLVKRNNVTFSIDEALAIAKSNDKC